MAADLHRLEVIVVWPGLYQSLCPSNGLLSDMIGHKQIVLSHLQHLTIWGTRSQYGADDVIDDIMWPALSEDLVQEFQERHLNFDIAPT